MFILDEGMTIHCWNGSQCSRTERMKVRLSWSFPQHPVEENQSPLSPSTIPLRWYLKVGLFMDFRPHYRRTFEDGIKWLIFIFFRHSRYLLSPFVGNLAFCHIIFVWLPPLYAVAKIYGINKVQGAVWWEVLVFQGIEVARRIRDEERGGKAKLVIIGTISHCIHFNQPASK